MPSIQTQVKKVLSFGQGLNKKQVKISVFARMFMILIEKNMLGHDGPVLLHCLICKSLQTKHYNTLPIDFEHRTPETELKW